MSTLLLGLSLVASSVLLFLVIAKATRLNVSGGVFSESWVANFYAPLAIGLFAFGCGFVAKFALALLV